MQIEIVFVGGEEVKINIANNVEVEDSANKVKQLIALIIISFRSTSLGFNIIESQCYAAFYFLQYYHQVE